MKTMTKEQAEKAAMEFANNKLNNGFFVQKELKRDTFYVYYALSLSSEFKNKSFPFIDLVPGDACLVWSDNQSETLTLFSCVDEDGHSLFTKRITNVIAGVGTYYTNYRKLDFNVLEIVKGWDDGE